MVLQDTKFESGRDRSSISKCKHKKSFPESLPLSKQSLLHDLSFQRRAFELDKIYKPKGLYKKSIEDIASERR